jgi:hypothetical protein
MPRVSHIVVAVTITEDDGTESTHMASGEPGFGVRTSLTPNYQAQIRRSTGEVIPQGVVSVHVELSATLHSDGTTRLFSVDADAPAVLTITESP